MTQFTIISLARVDQHIARVHVAGCKDVAKELRSGDVSENVTAKDANDAAAKYIAGELAEMGYSVADVKIVNCARNSGTQRASAAAAAAVVASLPCTGKWSRCGGANPSKSATWRICVACTAARKVAMQERQAPTASPDGLSEAFAVEAVDATPTTIAAEHCRSCGATDGETIYLARQNEGYTECCNKSLRGGDGRPCDDCFHA